MSSQWSTGSMPPPPGETVNLVDPPNQLSANIAIHTIFLTGSTLAILLRLYTRLKINQSSLGTDDYLACFAYLSNIAWTGVFFEAMRWGVGRNLWNEPVTWLVQALKWQTIASWIYIISETLFKLSFLFLYRRIFATGKKRTTAMWLIDAGSLGCLLFNVGVFFGVVFLCIPVEKAWNNALPGRCSNPQLLAYLTGAWNVFMDLFIFIVPIPLIRNLNMGEKQRNRLVVVFGIGAFACIASIVRLGLTFVLQSDADITYNMVKVGMWATIEINVGLTCSCLILLPAFLRRHLPESTKSSLRSFTFFSKQRSSKAPRNNPEWHGYQKQSDPYRKGFASDSCNLVPSSGKQIVQTNDFKMGFIDSPHYVPRNPEAGVPSLPSNPMSNPTYYVYQGPVVMGFIDSPNYVPRNPEAGVPSLPGSPMSHPTYYVYQGPVVMGSFT